MHAGSCSPTPPPPLTTPPGGRGRAWARAGGRAPSSPPRGAPYSRPGLPCGLRAARGASRGPLGAVVPAAAPFSPRPRGCGALPAGTPAGPEQRKGAASRCGSALKRQESLLFPMSCSAPRTHYGKHAPRGGRGLHVPALNSFLSLGSWFQAGFPQPELWTQRAAPKGAQWGWDQPATGCNGDTDTGSSLPAAAPSLPAEPMACAHLSLWSLSSSVPVPVASVASGTAPALFFSPSPALGFGSSLGGSSLAFSPSSPSASLGRLGEFWARRSEAQPSLEPPHCPQRHS